MDHQTNDSSSVFINKLSRKSSQLQPSNRIFALTRKCLNAHSQISANVHFLKAHKLLSKLPEEEVFEKKKKNKFILYMNGKNLFSRKRILCSTEMHATAGYVNLRQNLNRVLTASISSLTTSKFSVLELGNLTG